MTIYSDTVIRSDITPTRDLATELDPVKAPPDKWSFPSRVCIYTFVETILFRTCHVVLNLFYFGMKQNSFCGFQYRTCLVDVIN